MKGQCPVSGSETTLSLFPNKEISKGKMLSWMARVCLIHRCHVHQNSKIPAYDWLGQTSREWAWR